MPQEYTTSIKSVIRPSIHTKISTENESDCESEYLLSSHESTPNKIHGGCSNKAT